MSVYSASLTEYGLLFVTIGDSLGIARIGADFNGAMVTE